MPTPPARPGRKPNARANSEPAAEPRARASASTARKASAKAAGKAAALTSARARKSTPAATGRSTQARSGRGGQAGATVSAPAATRPASRRGTASPRTLSFDIGGTGLKASVLSKHGELLHEPVRIPTPYPLRPEQLVAVLGQMATGLPSYERVSAGFPGMIREGRVLSAPHFVCPSGEGSKSSGSWKRRGLGSSFSKLWLPLSAAPAGSPTMPTSREPRS
jgi:hypothetical protein